MKTRIKKLKLHTIDIITEWTSKTWHNDHRWKPKTGKFIKRMLNKKGRRAIKTLILRKYK
jgi:hypothetical protein